MLVPLQTRVGIATGMVVVGDLIGVGASAGARHRRRETARLQGLAEPNMVVIAEARGGCLGNLFDLEDLGRKELKGIAGATRAFRRDARVLRKAASRPSTPAA